MLAVFYCVISGLMISIQGSFNARMSEKIGTIETVTFTHLVGLITSLILLLIIGKGDLLKLGEAHKLYWTGGAMGVIIVFGVASSVGNLGPSLTMGIVVISQLIMGLLIEWAGLFEHEKIKFALNQPLGVAIMIVGLLVLKMK